MEREARYGRGEEIWKARACEKGMVKRKGMGEVMEGKRRAEGTRGEKGS